MQLFKVDSLCQCFRINPFEAGIAFKTNPLEPAIAGMQRCVGEGG